jgi:nitrite reductase/ring-hydroxylating ferredoxin subunit
MNHNDDLRRFGCLCAPHAPATTRRSFLGAATALVAGVLADLGAPNQVAAAFRVRWDSGLSLGGDEVSYPIPPVDGATIDRDNQVILVRYQNRVLAFALTCPHQNTALRWLSKENRFQCPRHESRYQPDGTYISGRATRNMDRFALRRNGNNVVVDLARLLRSDQDVTDWQAASVAL